MSSSKSLSDYIQRVIDNQDVFIKRVTDEWNKESAKTIKKMKKHIGEYKTQEIERIFNDSVTEFYDAYPPLYYQRKGNTSSKTGGLYDVLKIRTDEDGMVIANDYIDLFDPNSMHKDRKGNDLFTKVFMEGWHGGAENIHRHADIWGQHPSPGTPYYRTGGFVKWFSGSNRYVWRRYGKWGRKAKQTKSPYILITAELDRAQEHEMKQEVEKIVQEDFSELAKNMTQKALQIEKEVFM